jgi:hypothetical protein
MMITTFLAIFIIVRLPELNAKIHRNEQLGISNKVEVYIIGLAMGVVALPLYPEVAREHLSMYYPFPEGGKNFENDFFLNSSVVQAAINKSKNSGESVRLEWPVSAYQMSLERQKYWEARISMAINGALLTAYNDKVQVKVHIEYPQKTLATLINIPEFGSVKVEEGLFRYLQDSGWLHQGYFIWAADLKK